MDHISKHQGNCGREREISGMKAVVLPNKTYNMIEEAVMMNQDVVPEKVVLQVLEISKKTLCNDISSGKMPKEDYTTAYNGRRFYFLKLVLGLKCSVRRMIGIKERISVHSQIQING